MQERMLLWQGVNHCCGHRTRAVIYMSVIFLSLQVGATISAGGRPEVPPREALPGPDTPGWPGLDAYVQLMR